MMKNYAVEITFTGDDKLQKMSIYVAINVENENHAISKVLTSPKFVYPNRMFTVKVVKYGGWFVEKIR